MSETTPRVWGAWQAPRGARPRPSPSSTPGGKPVPPPSLNPSPPSFCSTCAGVPQLGVCRGCLWVLAAQGAPRAHGTRFNTILCVFHTTGHTTPETTWRTASSWWRRAGRTWGDSRSRAATTPPSPSRTPSRAASSSTPTTTVRCHRHIAIATSPSPLIARASRAPPRLAGRACGL